MLIICYIVVFSAAAFIPKSFLAIAFDSGGVTTGPMTVPFIMALGIGLSTIGKDKNSGEWNGPLFGSGGQRNGTDHLLGTAEPDRLSGDARRRDGAAAGL